MDIRQTFLSTLMKIGESFMIETHQVQNSSMDIMYVGAVGDCFESKIVGFAVAHATLHPPPAIHIVNP